VTGTGSASRLLVALRQIAEALDTRHTGWALVGGLAVSIRAEPRFTRDIDVAVSAADDAAAEALVADLTAGGFALQLSLEQRVLNRLATVRLLAPHQPAEGIVIDLLFASSGIEPDICREAERLEVAPGLIVPVARTGHLVAMKILALAPDRPQDAIDLRALVAGLTDDERARARTAAARIDEVGANRGKSMRVELERWL
jgi:hypothetical protein